MSLLLDALRQAEKNKADQSKKKEDETLKSDSAGSNLAPVSNRDDEQLVELDTFSELELSPIQEDGLESKLFEGDQMPQTAEQQSENSQQDLSLEDVDKIDNVEEISELLVNEINQDENRPLIDDVPVAEINDVKNNDTEDKVSIDKPLIQPSSLEAEVEIPELDGDAITVLQTNKNTDKKTTYWLMLFFLLFVVLCIAGYLYSLTIIPDVQTYSDEYAIAEVIDAPVLVDISNNSNASNPGSNNSNLQNSAIDQQQAELKSDQIDPVLAVMARPEQNKLAESSQTAKNDIQHRPKKTKPVSTFYLEEDDNKSIDYPKKINIKVKRQQSAVVRNLLKAYSTYRKQDYFQAESLYKKVLRQDKSNIDALLGLAAIAEQLGDIRRAQLLFQKVLNLNANHVVASNALIRLQKGQNPAENESRYKTLIEKFPDSAESYAALANIYASRQQWHQAQEAYFKAVEHSPETAYYHFNLAVSLDNLSKKTAAILYYKKALQLSESSQTMFDKSVVEQRIQQLQGQK